MNYSILKVCRFFGSVYFAILLIGSAALYVIIGTLLESKYDSHLYASQYIYSHWSFNLLLCFFFVNILFSTLQRYPFKRSHLPFIITHIGLLMVISGAFIKNIWGLQGFMVIEEGAASQKVLQPYTYALQVLEYASQEAKEYSLAQLQRGVDLQAAKLRLAAYHPHAPSSLAGWLTGRTLMIAGLPPIEIASSLRSASPLVLPFHPYASRALEIYAANVLEIDAAAEAQYIKTVIVEGIDEEGRQCFYKPLHECLANQDPDLEFQLEFAESKLQLTNHAAQDSSTILLSGPEALLNTNNLRHLGKPPLTLVLKNTPTLLFLRDAEGKEQLYYFSEHGEISKAALAAEQIASYRNGFLGYTLPVSFYAYPLPNDLSRREEAARHFLKTLLEIASTNREQLAPPLQLLQTACQSCGENFADVCIEFLDRWNQDGGWLYTASPSSKMQKVMKELNWPSIPKEIVQACCMASHIFEKLQDPQLLRNADILQALTLEIFSRPHAVSASKDNNHTLLSAWMRLHGIHLQQFPLNAATEQELYERLAAAQNEMHPSSFAFPITLEKPLELVFEDSFPNSKLENNRPSILVAVKQNEGLELHRLPYEPLAKGFKWAILNGSHAMRFVPASITLPYRVRLRTARQLNYPGTNQAYSYESDLLVTDTRTGKQIEKTISMNNVLETWEGYRFYLSNITPADESEVKTIQLTVNYDPAKYYLTYPGAIILTIGTILVFWFRGRKSIKNNLECGGLSNT